MGRGNSRSTIMSVGIARARGCLNARSHHIRICVIEDQILRSLFCFIYALLIGSFSWTYDIDCRSSLGSGCDSSSGSRAEKLSSRSGAEGRSEGRHGRWISQHCLQRLKSFFLLSMVSHRRREV